MYCFGIFGPESAQLKPCRVLLLISHVFVNSVCLCHLRQGGSFLILELAQTWKLESISLNPGFLWHGSSENLSRQVRWLSVRLPQW